MNLSDYEIIIRPKPITEFDSVEDLQRWLERQKQPESAQEIRRREQREQEAVEALRRYLQHRQRTLSLCNQTGNQPKSVRSSNYPRRSSTTARMSAVQFIDENGGRARQLCLWLATNAIVVELRGGAKSMQPNILSQYLATLIIVILLAFALAYGLQSGLINLTQSENSSIEKVKRVKVSL